MNPRRTADKISIILTSDYTVELIRDKDGLKFRVNGSFVEVLSGGKYESYPSDRIHSVWAEGVE